MISVVVEHRAASFRIGTHVFPVSLDECRDLARALSMTGELRRIIEEAAEWTLGSRWMVALGGPNQRPRDDRRNRVEFHCDGKSWHLLPEEAAQLAESFAAAATQLADTPAT